eukprot:3995929-Amphidinium_carterae.1
MNKLSETFSKVVYLGTPTVQTKAEISHSRRDLSRSLSISTDTNATTCTAFVRNGQSLYPAFQNFL